MEPRKGKRGLGVRLLILTGLASALAVLPVRGQEDCEACVWEWNGSGYQASCQTSTVEGYDGCIVADTESCFVGENCIPPG